MIAEPSASLLKRFSWGYAKLPTCIIYINQPGRSLWWIFMKHNLPQSLRRQIRFCEHPHTQMHSSAQTQTTDTNSVDPCVWICLFCWDTPHYTLLHTWGFSHGTQLTSSRDIDNATRLTRCILKLTDCYCRTGSFDGWCPTVWSGKDL